MAGWPGLRLRQLFQAGALLTAAHWLAACSSVGPNFQAPQQPLPEGWQSASLQALPRSEPARDTPWWARFDDPALAGLVDEALRQNVSVRIAGLRILESEAQLGIVGSSLYPQLQQLSGSALALRSRDETLGQTNTVSTGQFNAGFTLGWELDFWGKFRRSIEAADADYFASLARYDDIQVLMAAQVADLYVSVRTLEARLQIAHDNAVIQKRSFEITERLYTSGNNSELDVQQAKTQYLSTLSSIPALESSLRQLQNALAALLGRPPGPLPEMATHTGELPAIGPGFAAHIPADVLRRRPDVRVAEMQLAAQSALIGVAEADKYPSLSLLGAFNLSVLSLSGSPTTSTLALGPGLTWNIFDYGRVENAVRVQDARYQQLVEQYRDTVLQAAREVDNAATALIKGREQLVINEEVVVAAQRALDIATIRYREGFSDFSRVLDAQRTYFTQNERVVTTRSDMVLSLIALYKALGGGWEPGRLRPLVDDATRQQMQDATDWGGMLDQPLPLADAPAGVSN
ncbi:MAG: efflux transporter outer membrane subunit [Thiobacillus sp.]